MTTMTREFRSTLAAWKRAQPAVPALHAIPEKSGRDTRTGRRKLYCGPAALMIATGMPFEIADKLLQVAKKQATITGAGVEDMTEAFRLAGWEMSRNKLPGGTPRKTYTEISTRPVTLARASRLDFGRRWKIKTEAKTLAQWLETRTVGQMLDITLVGLTAHWIVVKGTRGCDNKTKVPVALEKMPHRRCRVESVYALTRR